MSKQANSIDDFFSVWDSHTELLNSSPYIDINNVQPHKPINKHYTELIRQEVVLIIFSIVLFILYLKQWHSIFDSPSAPQGAYIVTLFIWIIGIVDSLSMIIRVSGIHLQNDTALEVARKSATLAFIEKIELLIAVLCIIPLTLFFLVPTTVWLISKINLYTDWSIYKEIYTIPLIVATILDIIACGYLSFKNTKYIKEKISEWKYYKQLTKN